MAGQIDRHIRRAGWKTPSYFINIYVPVAAREVMKGVNASGMCCRYAGTSIEEARQKRDQFLDAMSRAVARS